MNNNTNHNNFLYPKSPYHGQICPENLIFNANLQEFSQKISYVCNLETAGKLSSAEAYKQIKSLWKDLKRSKKNLNIGKPPFEGK